MIVTFKTVTATTTVTEDAVVATGIDTVTTAALSTCAKPL